MKLKNRRIIPTNNVVIEDRRFSLETFLKFQVESRRSKGEGHRYIYEHSINYTLWAKELGVDKRTLKKNIDYLLDIKALIKKEDSDGEVFFKIKNTFQKYVLFEEQFIRKLLDLKCKNLIKVYIIYYKYCRVYNNCELKREMILEHLGLTNNPRNCSMIKSINEKLIDLGLIVMFKDTIHRNRTTRTLIKIFADEYQRTKFFKE
ncbi:hypothetical protein C0L75_03050 [Clostridium perfringens]